MCEVINNTSVEKKRLFMQMNECNAQQFLLLINISDAFFPFLSIKCVRMSNGGCYGQHFMWVESHKNLYYVYCSV